MREMAAKTVFLLASYLPRVSEDWVVGESGLEPRTHCLRVVDLERCACLHGICENRPARILSAEWDNVGGGAGNFFSDHPISSAAAPHVSNVSRIPSEVVGTGIERT
jgi:hypothetical protein